MRIGLLSDSHSFLDPTLRQHFAACDEIWHAGDIGVPDLLDTLRTWKPVRAVYGNIDDARLRRELPLDLIWNCEDVKVLMTHIAGYPGRYNARARDLIRQHRPGLVICGHSHILKVLYDQSLQHLHVNPGACGVHGFHVMRTAVRFTIEGSKISDMQVIELGKRGSGSALDQ